MIIVKLKVSTKLPASYWKQQAIGSIDAYGNPFRIIKLKWNSNVLHKNSEYAKTRGFEDAVIDKNQSTGDFKITYRRNGSITWQKPDGGVGAYWGELPLTQYNIQKLVSHYGDKLWFIVDPDIEAQVKILYEKRIAGMSKAAKTFNENRVMLMHKSDVDVKSDVKFEIPVDNNVIQEKQRSLSVKEIELAKKEALIAQKEKELADKEKALVNAGSALAGYGKNYLIGQTIATLRKHCKELGIEYGTEHKKGDLVEMIMNKQAGGVGSIPSNEISDNDEDQPENENSEGEVDTGETLDS